MHLIRPMIAMVGLAGLVAGLAACRIPGPDGAPDSAQPAVQAGNLLPNASFELPLGEEPRQPGNWGDILNPLTINLAATNQQPGNWPPRRVEAEAVEGNHAARIALDPAGDAFLGPPDLPGGPGPGRPGLYALGLCQKRGSIGLAEAVLLDPTPGLEGPGPGGFRRSISGFFGA